MRLQSIIKKLCKHEISKEEAISKIQLIIDGLRKNNAIQFNVESVSYSSENNHGYLKLKLPYQYTKIKNKVNKGDKVDVVFLP